MTDRDVLEKASSPINITDLGMSIEVREEQESNACSPIEVTESGMFMVARKCNIQTQKSQ